MPFLSPTIQIYPLKSNHPQLHLKVIKMIPASHSRSASIMIKLRHTYKNTLNTAPTASYQDSFNGEVPSVGNLPPRVIYSRINPTSILPGMLFEGPLHYRSVSFVFYLSSASQAVCAYGSHHHRNIWPSHPYARP